MGVDYDAELIVGFYIDLNYIELYKVKNNIENDDDIYKFLENKYKLEKKIHFCVYGNLYSGVYEYYLTFNDKNLETKIRDIKKIDQEMLDIAKKIYKEMTEKDLNCDNVDDIPIYSVLYVW